MKMGFKKLPGFLGGYKIPISCYNYLVKEMQVCKYEIHFNPK
jgi:hypothetical protein